MFCPTTLTMFVTRRTPISPSIDLYLHQSKFAYEAEENDTEILKMLYLKWHQCNKKAFAHFSPASTSHCM